MNELVLRLFFHGLIAFVPTGSNGMEAYMVDHEHFPALVYEMNRNSACPQEVCRKADVSKEPGNSGDWCFCDIDGMKISFQPQTVGPTRPIDAKPDKLQPESASQAADFSWLVRMANVQDGNPVYIKDFEQIKSLVSARMSFKWLSERSCHLDQISTCECEDPTKKPAEDCEFRVYPFRFVGVCDQANHRQALSEYAAFDLRLPFRPVRLMLEREGNNGEGEGQKVTIDLGCEPRACPDVLIANVSENYGCPDPESPDVGSHFLAYYELAQDSDRLKKLFPSRLLDPNSLSVEEKQLVTCLNDPVRKLQDLEDRQSAPPDMAFVSTTSGMAFVGRVISLIRRAAQTRIICPMAMFDSNEN